VQAWAWAFKIKNSCIVAALEFRGQAIKVSEKVVEVRIVNFILHLWTVVHFCGRYEH